jgi:hypothetical protein
VKLSRTSFAFFGEGFPGLLALDETASTFPFGATTFLLAFAAGLAGRTGGLAAGRAGVDFLVSDFVPAAGLVATDLADAAFRPAADVSLLMTRPLVDFKRCKRYKHFIPKFRPLQMRCATSW